MAALAASQAAVIGNVARARSTRRSAKRAAAPQFGEFSGLKSASGALFASSREVDASAALYDAVLATPQAAGRQVTSAKIRVAINGFGRIGRNFLRCWHGRGAESPFDVVCVNDSGGVKSAVHLLKYDSILGTFNADVKVIDDKSFSVGGKTVQVVSARDPLQLPWKDMKIDIVIEGTGVFIDGPGAGKHIQAGAKRVLITAPAKGNEIPTYVMGVNDNEFDPNATIVSNASCTTNCLAPFVKVLDEKFGIVKGTMTTTHSYTGDQRLLDASHRDLRRARAAALNIVPTSTGAAKAVALVLPQLKGKLNGIALRVPTPNVSVVDLVINTVKKNITKEEVNDAFRAAARGPMRGVLAVSDLELVSIDFRCSDVSSTIDSSLTMVMGDDMLKVVAWYDNEWGYSQRVVDLCNLMAKSLMPAGAKSGGDPLEQFCKDNADAEECRVFEE